MPLTYKPFTLGKHLDMQPITRFSSVAAYVLFPHLRVPPTINFTQNDQVDILEIRASLLQNHADFSLSNHFEFYWILREYPYVLILCFPFYKSTKL